MNEDYLASIQKHTDILSLRDLAPGTVASYTSYLKQFLEWLEKEFPVKKLSELTFEEIRSYILYLKNIRELNNRTINLHIAQLRDFFRYVLHRDWDPYEVPYLHFDEYLPSVPTREEVETLINSFTNCKHMAEIAVMYSSGLRVSEVCRLRCGDIQVSNKRIYVSRSKNRSDRFAVLSEKAYTILRAYAYWERRSAAKTDWLFPGQKEGRSICTQSVYNVLKNQFISLGWQDRGYNCHSLRHAFGLHLYEAGTDLISIKEAMGHKSLSSTEIYLSLGIGNGRSVKSPYDM